ncbi:helix-turn-helix transcriptional regulator [Rhodococcus qingshengii]|uniref:Helix-turn-helix transcriptional regulator n=1 Tax=Rhodococcus qingshengii TaxID=334542 RepID=A0AAW6LV11_RHOSG|nr:helix-turn-helix transcriptional regulator [Rhodococcus qingshengii]MDE8648952.1 helix-turn-helix transcriptional regulator [Rhodococcus qingshengii]
MTEENVFQVRLNELFARSSRRLTNKAVVNGMAAHGVGISTPYLSQLRTGMRDSPSDEVVLALAKYFDVSPGYFFSIPWSGDREAAYGEDEGVVGGLEDPDLQKLLSTSNGLSSGSLDLLADVATKLRAAEARYVIPVDSSAYVRLAESRRRKS